MRLLKLVLLFALLIVVIGGAGAWYLAGRQPGPTITITSPEKFVGRSTPFSITIESESEIVGATVYFDQNGKPLPLADVKNDRVNGKMVMSGRVDGSKKDQIANGPVTLIIEAARTTLYGYRTVSSRATRDLVARLDPPRVAVTSIHHFINLGGAEFVVMRVTPHDVSAGIRVGDTDYPAYPGSAVGLSNPDLRVAFFALRHDQDINTRMTAFAQDEAGNQATAVLDRKPFNKVFLQSKIPVDQPFLDRVVPAIASNTPDLKVDANSPDGLLKGFLTINGELRKKNNEAIAALAAKSQPQMLWKEAFAQMGNTQVESRFADRRTYFSGGKEIDRQVHLGFDLASVQQAPVRASNAGAVVFADYLGIYGNCVIIDHGLGVQSLYAHLSTMAIKPGDNVTKGQEIGRTGSTGLAGGDHLHFTVLLQGTPVNPVEWWDPHWMQDRVFRKIKDAGGS